MHSCCAKSNSVAEDGTKSSRVDSKIYEKSPAGLEDTLKDLNLNGCHLWKIRSPTKRFRRKFYIDLASMRIKYDPAYKNNCTTRSRKYIDIGDIQDVRRGWKTDTFNKVESEQEKKAATPGYVPSVEERRCFSIIYGKTETLDLIAPTVEEADKWFRSLRYLLSWYTSREQEKSYENWLRKKFANADLDKNNCLSFNETLKLLAELNINMDEGQARRLFNEANTTNSGGGDIDAEVLDEDEFIAYYFRLLQRPEIEKLFERHAANGVLTADQLRRFLQKEQGGYENVTMQECKELISIHEQSSLKTKYEMSSSGFVNMLLSPNFELFNQNHKKVYQDMTQPLTHYFIATSHNTYLLGNQLSSASSVEGYVSALKRGCRCVELDIWDGQDGEPIICHGYTLTSKILFKEVLKDAIKPYAFIKSKFPLILSLENHCTQPFQQKVAEYLREILGDMLYTEPVTTDMMQLPSPLELQKKIIIKAKKTKPKRKASSTSAISTYSASTGTAKVHYETSSLVVSKTEGVKKSETSSSTSTAKAVVQSRNQLYPNISSSGDYVNGDDDSSESEEDDIVDSRGKLVHDAKVTSADLNSLVNIMQGAHFRSFPESKVNGKWYHITSFNESKAQKFIAELGADFVDYNKRIMSRIYPGGARTGSSNFDPVQFWSAGCQCVALNYQTEDMPNFYNYGWFTENGSCGYVLKPEFLRNPSTRFNPTIISQKTPTTLKIRIISAQHLPKIEDNPDIVDPYVEIKVVGLAQDNCKHATQFIHNNGFNPIWDATFELRVGCPELAMLYFCIKDYAQSSSNTPLAYYVIPFSALATGYRHIHLVNLLGNSLAPSTLFVHVTLSKP